jgi:hypothetical protein
MTQRKHRFGFLAVLSLASAVCADQAVAQETAAYFTGPLLTPNAVTLPAGTLLLEPYLIYTKSNGYYGAKGRHHRQAPGMRQWQTSIPVYYGITNRLQLHFSFGGAHAASGGAHTTGVGATDTSLGMQYMVLPPDNDRQRPAISLAYAHRFPTGAYDRLDQNPLNATGNGANVDTFSALLQEYVRLPNGRPMRLRTTVSFSPPPERVKVNGMSAYSTPRKFHGRVKLGNSLNISTAMEYSINTQWALAMDLAYNRDGASQLHGVVTGGDTASAVAHRYDSRDIYSLAPAVEYNINDRIGIVGGAQVSVAGRNSNAFIMPMIALNMVL